MRSPLRCARSSPRSRRLAEMPAIEGTCLCGAVHVTVARKPHHVTQCNCTVCRKYGTLWAYYRRRAIEISGKRASFSRRRGGLRFTRCVTCGCVVSWERERGPEARMAVNARLLDHAVIATVPISVLDGDGNWRVLERYLKPGTLISPRR
jgi:hypothetical protein